MGHIIYIINDITCELQKTTFKLLITPDAMLAAPLFFYAGFSLSFFSGIFSTSIGNTKVSDLLQTKARCVFSTWPKFCLGQYRVDDHREDALTCVMKCTVRFISFNFFVPSFSMMQQAF